MPESNDGFIPLERIACSPFEMSCAGHPTGWHWMALDGTGWHCSTRRLFFRIDLA